eukprot:Transcript_3848.p1 GENE.Transcript_3848~~Transcript_3848.p1  ORF type:complete len:378 (-),score=132.01 Transcript_3848:70-1143(-)
MACHLVWAATATALRPSALPARLPATLRPLHAQRVVTMAEAEATASTGSLPPDSFQELISHAAESTVLAISEGSRLIEVEFPPIPVSKLDDPGLSAYDVLSANLRLCIEYCKKLQGPDGPTGGKPIAITLPDAAELRRSQGYLGTAEPWPNVRLNSLGGDTAPSNPLAGVFGSIFKAGGAVDAVVAEWAGMYVLVGQSCQELPTIRALHEKAPDVPIVCFNLKLDTLRGDLGLPAFPSRDVHHTFLCKVKPVYYMRPRSYSLSLSRAPFLMSYSGVLFRRYPEGWQTLLDRGTGKSYRQVKMQEVRPALGTFKAELTESLRLNDAAADSAISQAGFKQSTWWEDNKDGKDVSFEWRR